ncbi:hypothetical protein CPC08DRAFT_769920 [Agrocybe pediades]|nr:hypothetical protein CPC08DRAFT_769920 [Agrocybe pediades]
MSDVNVDDTDTTSISYSGSWETIGGGPSDEFDGTVHSTKEHGASATIRFQGTRIVMRCTVPQGNALMVMEIFVDNELDTVVTRSQQDTTTYDDTCFDSTFAEGQHELAIHSGGSAVDGPFQPDRFIVTGSVVPVQGAPPPPESPSSATSSPGATHTTNHSSSITVSPTDTTIGTSNSLSLSHFSLATSPG